MLEADKEGTQSNIIDASVYISYTSPHRTRLRNAHAILHTRALGCRPQQAAEGPAEDQAGCRRAGRGASRLQGGWQRGKQAAGGPAEG